MSLIKLTNVKKVYKNGVVAINGLDLEVEKGESVFVIGASGSGKSSFIKMLYREEKPTEGKIIIGGLDVAKLRNRKVFVLRRKIGVVFQDFKLLPKKTVYENIAFALEVFGDKKVDIRRKVYDALGLVGLKDKANDFPNNLSGGEQQRVAIARAIVNKPKLLICDEPTGNLDPKISLEIVNVLDKINKLGTTVLVVTHDHDIVNEMKKRVIVIDKGHLKKDYKEGKYSHEDV